MENKSQKNCESKCNTSDTRQLHLKCVAMVAIAVSINDLWWSIYMMWFFFIPPYIYDEGLFYLSIHFILWKGTSTFRSRIFIFYCNAATNPSSPWPKVVSMIKYILLIMVDYIPNHLHIFITSTLQ